MVLVLTKNTQWKFGTRKGFLKRPERGNGRNNEEFVKCRCKMPCSLPSSLARSATKSRQFTPDGQGQFLRRDDDGRSVGRPMGRVAQRRDCKKDTEREAKPSPPSDRASASVGSVPSLECRVLRPSSVSLQLVNKFVLDSRDSRSYLYYLESKSHVKRENFIFAATSIIGGQSQSSVRIFFDFFRLSSFFIIRNK